MVKGTFLVKGIFGHQKSCFGPDVGDDVRMEISSKLNNPPYKVGSTITDHRKPVFHWGIDFYQKKPESWDAEVSSKNVRISLPGRRLARGGSF